MGVQYLSAYHQVVSTSSIIIYHLFILLPHYLRELTFSPLYPPPTKYDTPPGPNGHKKEKYLISLNRLRSSLCRWVSPLTTTLPETHLLLRMPTPPTKASLPSDFRYSPPLPLPLPPLMVMSHLLIYSNISFINYVSLRPPPHPPILPESRVGPSPGRRVGGGPLPFPFLLLIFFWGLKP